MIEQERNQLRCKRCGCYAVTWRQTKDGRWYLAIRIIDPTPEDRSYLAAGAARRPHKCDTHRAIHDESSEAYRLRLLAAYRVRMTAR